MRRVLTTGAALALSASMTMAGGIERSTQSVAILFEEGRYGEFSLGYFDPKVTGSVGGGAVPSGDMSPGYATFSFGYKQDLGENFDLAVIVDQPVGADVSYPASAAPYPLAGSTAAIDSLALTGLLRYKFPSNVSLIGGIRAQSAKGEVSLPGFGYTMSTNTDYRFGYVLGAAWEKPDIAARVALTYNSAITHKFDSLENGVAPGNFESEIPQSVNLEFQTGVAADTLLFGSIRWVDWKAFDISPPNFPANPLVSYDSNRTTYTLGVGRRFNENWSGAVVLGHEASSGDFTGNLGPTDGYDSLSLAGTYTNGNMKITGGIRYVKIGDATTSAPVSGSFTDNSGVGFGVRVGFNF